ncbi:hypothetical protein NL676_032064 [Syzygium grande]|nr:hypothetical protein NL676_032064 [Syzygium grande]
MGLRYIYTRGLVCTTFCIFFIAILEDPVQSSSNEVSYEVCKPRNCGGNRPNISYPFYIPEEERELCGYPGFELKCEGTKTIGGRCGRSQDRDFLCYYTHGANPQDCNRGLGKRCPWWKIGLGIGIGSLTIIMLSYMIHLKRKNASLKFHLRNSTSYPHSSSEMEESNIYFEVPIFTNAELEEATNNFSASNELGGGGFGTVYYGKLRDGREVAVKRLYERSYRRVKQFMNEVEILTRLQHKNLVSLYGCTSCCGRELLLVYEYISNGTVADHIHGQRANSSTTLPWKICMDMAIETATALAYLHASDIVHRDLPKGLRLCGPQVPSVLPSHTEKSGVYSFGVVLIELVSSKPAVDQSRERHEINLANFAINKIQKCGVWGIDRPKSRI